MFGLKGLIPSSYISDETIQPIISKAEGYRKSTQNSIEFFQQVIRSFEQYKSSCQKSNKEIKSMDYQYHRKIILYFEAINNENWLLLNSLNENTHELKSLCDAIFNDFSNFLLNFQQVIKNYQTNENSLLQMSKKYFKMHKSMLNHIQSYKSSFTDAKLIYNNQEKVKRYQTCESTYKYMKQLNQKIQQKIYNLIQKRNSVVQNYDMLQAEYFKVLKVIGSKIISEGRNFVQRLCHTQQKIIKILADKKFQLMKEGEKRFFFTVETHQQNNTIFIEPVEKNEEQPELPFILLFPDIISSENLNKYNNELVSYVKVVAQKIDQRKSENRAIFEFFTTYTKILEKIYQSNIKDTISFFQKIRKKLAEVFGNRLVSFLKVITSILEFSMNINDKMIKKNNQKVSIISQLLDEENKMLKLFDQQLKGNVEKLVKKKPENQIKDVEKQRKQLKEKSQFFISLVRRNRENILKNYQEIKKNYIQILSDLELSYNELFSLSSEYKELYYGSEQFLKNFKKYEEDINSVIDKEKNFFSEVSLTMLKKEESKITFDGQMEKIQEFTKLQKPKQLEERNASLNMSLSSQQILNASSNSLKPDLNRISIGRQSIKYEGKQEKQLQFLLKKINFVEGETLIQTFSCALNDKIILQGRLYITNQRICFYSKFNAQNVFFKGTFLQIPKQDLKNVEKKTNALIFKNSISVTTVNGEVFFTSFFSRDDAYDVICKTFRINLEEQAEDEEEEEMNEASTGNVLPDFLLNLEEENNLKEENAPNRQKKLEEQIKKFDYQEIGKTQFKRTGLTAYKLFKLFYCSQEITINKKPYSSFLFYFKQLLGHKDIEIGNWLPNLSQILNSQTGKQISSMRRITAIVPIANTGVPFVPKTARSTETQTIYFISKDKWILEGTVDTVGAPYADTFRVQFKTTVCSSKQGQCQISIEMYINFIKNTVVKRVIQTKTLEQSTNANKLFLEEMKKYFKELDKPKKRSLKYELEQMRNDLENANKEKESLIEANSKLQKQLSLKYKLLIVSVILNVFLAICMLS